MRLRHVTALVAVICLASAAAVVVFTWRGEAKLKVFHAGSLTAPMRDFIDAFAEIKPGVTVENEVSGSVAAIRKVTELNRTADVVMVADYKLILEMMMPEYADFCLVFASNSMVLAYTDNSKLSGEINVDNWWEILLSDGVKVGFSNPNDDPCGYRALMVMALSDLKRNSTLLLDELIEGNTNIRYHFDGGHVVLEVPSNLEVNTDKICIRSKSVELVSLLEEGSLDYAFEYKSVAIQHGLKFIDLPPSLDLSSSDMSSWYSKVSVVIMCDREDSKTLIGEPILYGLTIPKVSENPQLAAEFVKMVLGDTGREILRENGQEAINPPLLYGELPPHLQLEVEVVEG